jgi:GcrA cell cycle regulator
MIWTDAMLARLSKLWLGRNSAAQIAALLGHGLTKNAICGKVRRMGLIKRKAGTPRRRALDRPPRARPALKPRPEAPRTPAKAFALPKAPKPVLALVAPVSAPAKGIPATTAKAVYALGAKQCKWPHGTPGKPGFHFCGEVSVDINTHLPYCEYHRNLAIAPYQPPLFKAGKREYAR